ncbi:hypothetical protein RCG23_14770 [Neobacillus sp. PS3-34]|uniref:OmpL47-type beta-barrel domain-containing protein n=1 Tax=Neobacillus sp. PS3-34 TaxID=3070678 RepID=UPI0027DF3F56|nr:hypothetical protein [Neobacillus sp. PS3-34]WML46893.1 hypothetical protein RCG23_14770 [Neobacillus sp. PS3-34]
MVTKRKFSSILVLLFLVFQVVSPIGTAFAAESGVLLPPSNLAYQASTPDDGKLVWSAVYGATGYNIYEIKEGQLVLLGTSKTNNYSLNNLAEGKYSYIISTLSTDGESGPCAPIDVDIVYPSMAAPATLTNTIQNGNDIVLSWGASQYAESYKVYQQLSDGTQKLLTTTTSRTFTVVNAPEGKNSFSISAENSLYGESPVTAPLDVNVVFPIMKEPANLSKSLSNGNDINLSWQAASYANSYKIYQVIDGQEVFKTSVTSTSAKFTNMPEGDYTYNVYSYSDRFGASAKASTASITVSPITMVPPSTVTSKLQNINDVVLTWGTAANATAYKVYQLIDGEKVLKGTYTGTTVTYTNQPGGDFTYEVYSYSDRFGESVTGTKVSLSVSTVTMAPPNNTAAKLQNLNDIVLTWDVASNADSYKVYQIVEGQRVLKTTVTGTTASFTNLPAGDYVYEVTSNSSRFGESDTGSQVTAKIDPVIMGKPAGFANQILNGNDIALSWEPVANATNYKVYQIVNGQKVLKSTLTTNSVTYTNMAAGDYNYQIYSYNSRFGESAEGASLSFSLVFPVMAAPANTLSDITSPTGFTLTWDASPFATNYKVYQVVNGTKSLKSTVSSPTVSFSNMAAGQYSYEIHSYSSRFGESKDGSLVTINLSGQALETPLNLSNTILNGNDIKLTWNSVQYAASYKIYRVIDGLKLLQTNTSATSVTYSNQPEGEYNYEVHSYSSLLGESPQGAELQLTLVHPDMQAPGNFTGTIKNISDITLTWNAVQFANSYKVYEIIDGQEVLKNTVTSTSITLSKVTEGTHTYVVRSFSTRFGESLEGSRVESTVTFPALLAPTNLTSSISNGNDITLRWTAATYATGYNIYETIDGQKQFVRTVTGTTTSFSNVKEGNHSYEVRTLSDRFGESADGTATNVTVVYPEMQKPATFTKTIINGNDINLSWAASTYATAYKVYKVVGEEKTLVKTTTATSVPFTNMPEGDYTYEVHSYSDRFGESVEGNTVTFTLVFPIMQAPVGATNTIANGNDFTLKWTAASYATGYKVYQIKDGQMVLIRTVTGTSTPFTNMPEGDYSYVVHSYSDRFGESLEGSFINFNLTWPVVQPPVLQGTIVNANNVTLTWNSVTWANEYRVYELKGDSKVLVYKGTALTYKIYNLTEETHSYQVTAYNTRFGESALSNTAAENIVYPVMQPPTATVKVSLPSSATVTWGFVTYANNYNVYELVDGAPVLVAKNVNNLSYTLTNLSYKNHEYYVTSYSNSFGESAPSNTVLAKLITDTQAPVTTSNAASSWSKNSQTVTLSATDNDTGVAKTYYSLNDAPFVEGTSITVEKEGINKLSFYSVDKVGNTEVVKTVNVMIDKTAPITSVKELPGSFIQSFTGELTAADTSSGVATTYYSINGSDFVEGTIFTVDKEGINQVSFYSVDQAGNKEDAKSINVKIDKTAPVTKADAPSAWVNEDVHVNLSASDSESGVARTYYSINGTEYSEGTSFTLDQEGINQVSFYSVDKAGNKEEAKTIEVKIDKTAPETKSDAPTSWVKEDVLVNLSATDNESGVAKTYYSINGSDYVEGTSFTVDQEGVNKVSFYSVDQAGNKEDAKSINVKIDKTAPVTKADGPSGWVNEDVQVILSASDSESGVARTYYSINGSEYTEGTSFTLDQEGINQVSFYSLDQAGNKEAAKTIEVKIDKTAPETKADAPAAWVKEDVQVNLSATDSQSGVAKTYYSINGSVFVEGTSFTIGKEGINPVSFYSLDQAGNKEAAKTIEIKIDKTAPETKADAPATWVNKDVAVNLSASDSQSGVAKTYYSINGSEYTEGTSFTVAQEGNNQISFYSVDQAGNKEEAETIEVKIDKTAPETKSDAPAAWVNEVVQVNLSASDSQSGVAKTYYSINGSVFVEGTSFTIGKEGINQVSFYTVDQAGNKEETKNIEVKIDKTAPVIKSYFNDLYELGSTLKLTYDTNDLLSGVSKEEVFLTTPNETIGKAVNRLNQITLDKPGVYTLTIFATDAAGNTQVFKKQFTVYIPASIEVTPNVIKGNNGVFTLRASTPDGFAVSGFDLNTAQLNGVKALNSNNGYYNQVKQGQFKFERSSFTWKTGQQALEFRCYLNGYLVIGHTTVTVKE